MSPRARPAPEPPPEPEVLALRLGQAIKAMHRLVSGGVMRNMQDEKQEQELSFSQVAALHQLRDREMTVTALAERTSLSLPAASHLAERLVRRELIGRAENPDNRREKLLTLTDLGRAHLARMDTAFSDTYVALFARVSPELLAATEANLRALVRELSPETPANVDSTPSPAPSPETPSPETP